MSQIKIIMANNGDDNDNNGLIDEHNSTKDGGD